MEKDEVMRCRVSSEQKKQFEKLAAALGMSLSAFIIGACTEKLVENFGQTKIQGF